MRDISFSTEDSAPPTVVHGRAVTALDIAALREALLSYYEKHKRDLPWRKSADPYAIWVSEIMLQQTRVDTVIPYYERFLQSFPSVQSLAAADEKEVLARWSGLGYYRRARMLHAGAQKVVKEHGGVVPNDPKALLQLPGIGAYTAGAIASIAFGQSEPILDGNVERVLTRVTAMSANPRENPARAELWALAAKLAKGPNPGALNQALMELGATVCLPANPQCLLCPARAHCAAVGTGDPEQFPVLPKKKPPRDEHWLAVIVRNEQGATLLTEPENTDDRWRSMLVPPLLAMKSAEVSESKVKSSLKKQGFLYVRTLGALTHVLTHAKMNFTLCECTLHSSFTKTPRYVSQEELDHLPIPTVTRKLLQFHPNANE